MRTKVAAVFAMMLSLAGCKDGSTEITVVDPGHFHASLILKHRLEDVGGTVHVYAPEGKELEDFTTLVNTFNTREDSPTAWKLDIHAGPDFLDRLPAAGKKDIAVISGNNRYKARYIAECIDKGYNVLADKPMAINTEDFALLKQAYAKAERKGLVIYDMMTERHSPLNRIIRTLVSSREFFGVPDGSIEMMDIHHFCKKVAGSYTRRPQWYYDVRQQGEGIADITTHHVDILFWECFPDRAFSLDDVKVTAADRYPTVITPEEFENTTGASTWPDYLEQDIVDGCLHVYSNGSVSYTIDGQPVTIGVRWDFIAPEGSGDTFQSTIPGTKAVIKVIQDESTGFKRTLFLMTDEEGAAAAEALLQLPDQPKAQLLRAGEGLWEVRIAEEAEVDHEDQFSLVADTFIRYVKGEEMPQWENANTLAKYYITTEAVRMAAE